MLGEIGERIVVNVLTFFGTIILIGLIIFLFFKLGVIPYMHQRGWDI